MTENVNIKELYSEINLILIIVCSTILYSQTNIIQNIVKSTNFTKLKEDEKKLGFNEATNGPFLELEKKINGKTN